MLTFEELTTQYHELNRRTMYDRLEMGRLIHVARTQFHIEYKDFAQACGTSYSSVREYGLLYRFYLPVMAELFEELEHNATVLHKTLLYAKTGLGVENGYTPEDGARLALQRLKDWAGLSVEQIRLQVTGQDDGKHGIVREFICTRYDIVSNVKKVIPQLSEGNYRFVIYEVD